MALSNIEKHYNKHPEDLRLLRRHGMVEFATTMHHLHRYLQPGAQVLDIGAGTGNAHGIAGSRNAGRNCGRSSVKDGKRNNCGYVD